MNVIIQFIIVHPFYAPIIVSICVLLAGLNIPISIDILLALCAFLAATIIPEMKYPLYVVFLISSILSAWIAYSIGKIFNHKLLTIPIIKKLLPHQKIAKMNHFYNKYGGWTYLIARFIPFGVRNAVFISSGMSNVRFTRFAAFDSIGCILWSSIFYTFFYQLSANLDQMIAYLKQINLAIFIGFSVTLIGIVCYKYTKRKKKSNNDNHI
ncbi:MAG: DedA family protein [Chlamydiales bacterium]|nr:DedA family protein [Chlamydiales bacterium]